MGPLCSKCIECMVNRYVAMHFDGDVIAINSCNYFLLQGEQGKTGPHGQPGIQGVPVSAALTYYTNLCQAPR